MESTVELTGIVLCGGHSGRMGTDKAVLDLGGRALLTRAIDLLAPLCAEVLLASGPEERYGDTGCRRVLDVVADGGPLAGLASGLAAARTPWVLVLACDMPRVDGELARALFERVGAGDLDLCVLESERGLEPTCGVYHRRCLPAIEEALRSGKRRMNSFWDGSGADGRPLRAGTLRPGEANDLDPAVDRALNLNTPEELDRERRSLGADLDGVAGASGRADAGPEHLGPMALQMPLGQGA